MAGYWRPAKANYLGRITRDQLLALGRDTLGEAWAQVAWQATRKRRWSISSTGLSADPDKHGRTPEQVEKLKSWLPAGMAFGLATAGRNRPRRRKPGKPRNQQPGRAATHLPPTF